MRGAVSEAIDMLTAVDCMALRGEENGIGHGRIIPFLREVILLHTERTIRAAWGSVANCPRRNGPDKLLLTIHTDGHSLSVLVNGNDYPLGMSQSSTEKEHKSRKRRPKPH